MKEDLCSWYQGFNYEDGFGLDEVSFSQQKKKQINTHAIISALGHAEQHKIFCEDGGPVRPFFYKCNLCLGDNMDKLYKVISLPKDQGIMVILFGQVTKTHITVVLDSIV